MVRQLDTSHWHVEVEWDRHDGETWASMRLSSSDPASPDLVASMGAHAALSMNDLVVPMVITLASRLGIALPDFAEIAKEFGLWRALTRC